MRIIFDARPLDLYPNWSMPDAFHGGTEDMVKRLARGLADAGHTTHVITHHLPVERQIGPYEWYWGPNNYPKAADVLVLVHNMETLATGGITAPLVVMATNGLGNALLPDDQTRATVDAWPVFSKVHGDLLKLRGSAVDPDKIFLTGLGVDLPDYSQESKVFGRLLFANDPQRGLWHLLDIFDHLRLLVPEASLHITYDFDRQFEAHRWQASAMAETMIACRDRMLATPGIANVGGLSKKELAEAMRECQVHAMPSDPPNVGSQIHGITQMECAAAGAALVLSNIEAFPEVFGEAASILPLPGTILPDEERRYDAQDWAEHIADIICVPQTWETMSRKSRHLAERHTWDHVVERWNNMLNQLAGDTVENDSAIIPLD